MSFSLDKKTVFITGAGGLLGTTYIESILKAGGKVIASELKGERSKNLESNFGKNKNFLFLNIDVTNENDVLGIFKKLKEKSFEPNVVINNAAITGEFLVSQDKDFPNFSQTSLEEWKRTLDVNLTGCFLIAREMDRDIVGKYPSKLINVTSMYALKAPHHDIYENMPFKSFSAYSASKAGLHGLTTWLASYWSKRECNVNSFSPGAVFNNHSKEFQERVGKLIMSGKMAQPKEISDVMLFMCSEGSNHITGQMINVDGGFSAW
tara:strand:+ start:21119 stop:21910 length:792 start_codon:yes stop_codon:yes gene_type:complete